MQNNDWLSAVTMVFFSHNNEGEQSMQMRFNNWNCNVIRQEYQNGRTAIQLVAACEDSENDIYEGDPIASATVNIPTANLSSDEVLVKDYSENEGMLEALIAANIVEPTGRFVNSGFVSLPVCKVIAQL